MNAETTPLTTVDQKSHGGARPGSGRPKGVSNKLTATELLHALEKEFGHKYEKQLAMDFKEAITDGDKLLKVSYHKLILSKVVADLSSDPISEDETKKMSTEDLVKLAKELLKDL